MEQGKEQADKASRQEVESTGEGREKARNGGGNPRDEGKRARILQCLGNLNALHKVQGALLGQMEREVE